MSTPGQESTPVVVMTGTREHRAFLTCDGYGFTVPKECGPYIVRAVNSHAALVEALSTLVAATTGDIYTDAPECAASLEAVAAAHDMAAHALRGAKGN
jgi:hypothetical protein